jgi:cystathionine beta-lyase/cystathionine gamma-synthase
MSGFTGLLSVELRGNYQSAKRFISSLKLVAYAVSLGGFESLVVHPAAMWSKHLSPDQLHSMGVSESLVRISVGLEDEGDLINDFAQALEAS